MMIADEAVTAAVAPRVEEHGLAEQIRLVLARLVGLRCVQLIEVDYLASGVARWAEEQDQEQHKSAGKNQKRQKRSHLDPRVPIALSSLPLCGSANSRVGPTIHLISPD